MSKHLRARSFLRWVVVAIVIFAAMAALGRLLLARADGPVAILPGGPLQSGEWIELADLDWQRLDAFRELELEIVAAESSRVLWFSVHDGIPYVSCGLDCMNGRLKRWPNWIAQDDRVVIRIDERRANARLIQVEHESSEYLRVRAGRNQKFAGEEGARSAAEAAAHDAIIEVGGALTGRANRTEPSDRLFRVVAR